METSTFSFEVRTASKFMVDVLSDVILKFQKTIECNLNCQFVTIVRMQHYSFCVCFLRKIECCSVDTSSDEDTYIPEIHQRQRKAEVSATCVTINQNSKKEDIGKLKTWFSQVIQFCFIGHIHGGQIRLFSFCMLVVDAMGEHMVEAYSSMSLVMALYIASIVSLCLSHLAEEKTLRMGSVLDDLSAVLSMCLLYVSLGSRVKPSIWGRWSYLVFIFKVSFVLCSARSGVKKCTCCLV